MENVCALLIGALLYKQFILLLQMGISFALLSKLSKFCKQLLHGKLREKKAVI